MKDRKYWEWKIKTTKTAIAGTKSALCRLYRGDNKKAIEAHENYLESLRRTLYLETKTFERWAEENE